MILKVEIGSFFNQLVNDEIKTSFRSEGQSRLPRLWGLIVDVCASVDHEGGRIGTSFAGMEEKSVDLSLSHYLIDIPTFVDVSADDVDVVVVRHVVEVVAQFGDPHGLLLDHKDRRSRRLFALLFPLFC